MASTMVDTELRKVRDGPGVGAIGTENTETETERGWAIRPQIAARSLRWFYAGVFALAWTGWWPIAAGAMGWLPLNLSWWGGIGPLAPTLVGIAVASREGGVAAVRDMLQRLFRWRVGVGWYALALLLRAGVGLLAIALVAFSTGSPLRFGAIDLSSIVGLTTAVLVFNFAEEIGWTGFAYPRLRCLFGPLTVGVIVGVVASVWHLPFWLAGNPDFPLLLGLLPVYVLPSALITVWLLEHTQQSVLISTLSHLATNVTMTALLLVPQGPADVPVYLVYALLLWIVAAAMVIAERWLAPLRVAATSAPSLTWTPIGRGSPRNHGAFQESIRKELTHDNAC